MVPRLTVLMRTWGAVQAPTGAFEQLVPQLVAPPVVAPANPPLFAPAAPPVPAPLAPADPAVPVPLAPAAPLLAPAAPLLAPAAPLAAPPVLGAPPLVGPEPPCPGFPPPGALLELDAEQLATPAPASAAPAKTASAAVNFLRGIVGRTVILLRAPWKKRCALAFLERVSRHFPQKLTAAIWLERLILPCRTASRTPCDA
jgi:hypothetical protein